jgi:hypothetical protein
MWTPARVHRTPSSAPESTDQHRHAQSGPVDLDDLVAFLLSDHAPEESFSQPGPDGFLIGIAVVPQLILRGEWPPAV